MMRTLIRAATVITVLGTAGCTGSSTPPPPPARSAPASPSSTALEDGSTAFDCTGPIGVQPATVAPYSSILDVVGLDTTSTLQANSTDGTGPHRLFVKTGLLIHAGHESTLTVPSTWAGRLAIAWGNHAADWTASLHIPACPEQSGQPGAWYVFPGGFSIDESACVPLQVHAASKTTTVYVSAGARCARSPS